MSTLHTALPRLAPFALILTVLACDERSPSAPPPGAAARELRVLGGDGQQAVAGAALPDELVVAAVDAAGRPLPGIAIQLVVVSGGGQVAPPAPTSDGEGLARARWTLGTVAADSQVVEARVDGVPSRRLRALARPDAPAGLVVTGGGAAGQVGAPLPDSLAVTVRDRLGNPVEGVEVAWEVGAGGGSLSPLRSATRADGTAKAQWTLGPRADTAQVAVVRAGSLAPVTLTANAATRGVPLHLVKRGGDGQRGPAGAVLPEPLGVVLRMQDGRPVAGALVAWSVPAGAGTVLPAVSRTDSAGAASAAWRLGTDAGLVQATAAVDEGTLVFTALAESAAPARLEPAGGDGGAGPVGGALPDSLAVRVRDRFGNPVPGVEVAWEAPGGGGSLSPARGPTDAAGTARAQWTLGPRLDQPQAAQARVAGLPPVGFGASATTRGVPLRLSKRGGDGQRGPAGAVLADSLGVSLRMPDGRPVAGALVTWSVPPGAGTVAPAASRTDADGAASAAWRLGTAAGLVQATATVDEGTLVFTSLVEAAAPARAVAAAGGGDRPVGGPLADSLAVRVTDPYGNPVPGAEVAWAAAAGGGSVQPARSRTDAQGIARAVWTLAAAAGTAQSASATVPGLPAVAFHATATRHGVPLLLEAAGGDEQAGEVARVLADSLSVQVRSQAGTPVQGVTVAWAVTAGGGRVSPAVTRTDARGRAAAAWTLGTRTVPARAAAITDEDTAAFSATPRAGAPATVRVHAGDGQSAILGAVLPQQLIARVSDAYGNPVAGALVTWNVLSGGGTLQQPVVRTPANGLVSTRWAMGYTPGESTVAAVVDGATEARFTATAQPAALRLWAMTDDASWSMAAPGIWHLQARVVANLSGLGLPINPPIFLDYGGVDPLPWAGRGQWAWRLDVRVDTVFDPRRLPLPHVVARFEDQRVYLPLAPFWEFYGLWVTWPTGRPYYANETIRVGLRLEYRPRDDAPPGWVPRVSLRVSDDNGWSAVTESPGEVLWPLGTRLGFRKLTVCVPDTYSDRPCVTYTSEFVRAAP